MSNNLVDRIRQRLAETGLDMKSASLRAGLGATFVRDVLARGRSPRSDRLLKLAEALGVSVEWLLTGDGQSGALTIAPGEQLPIDYPRYEPNASTPLPVTFRNETIGMFGQAVGGEDGRFVLNGSRVMDVHCPPTLIGVKDAYGVFVHGSSMKPRYREGEAVFVNPHMPVRQDDYAIVQIRGDFEGDDVGGFIKQFISINSKEIILAQHQRPETFPVEEASEGRFLLRFPRSKVLAVHRIVWAGEV